MPSKNNERFDKNVLVVVENDRAEKEKVIRSALSKFVGSGFTIISPVEHSSNVVKKYCKDNDIFYAEVTVDQLNDFILNLLFGIMFFEGPNKASYSNKYRIGMSALGKMSIIVEVNDLESKDRV